MNIALQSGMAWERASAGYVGASKPLSFCRNHRSAQVISWWLENPRDEGIEQDRKRAALTLYLYLASQASLPPAEHQFPAEFRLADGVCLRPDKGVIKACLVADPPLIAVAPSGTE